MQKVAPVLGHSVNFVQDNESMSSYGVMRGLHFQRPPFTQSKLVRCVKGAVLDVAVDIRKVVLRMGNMSLASYVPKMKKVSVLLMNLVSQRTVPRLMTHRIPQLYVQLFRSI